MKHFTFFFATVMSLTVIMGILSGCKESNNSSTEQTVETATDADKTAVNDDKMTVPESKAPNNESEQTFEAPEIPEMPELEAPELPEIEVPDVPEVPELTPPDVSEAAPEATPEVPALPDAAPEATPEVPALPDAAPETTPEIPQPETPAAPETMPEVPQPDSPAVSEAAPEVPQPETPAAPDVTPEVPQPETPAVPDATPEATPEVPALTEAAPETPQLEVPALTEAAPETPQLEVPALTEAAPETPQLEVPALTEAAPQAPVASDSIQTEDMGLAELPDSAKAQPTPEPQVQTANSKAAQPETIAPKPNEIKAAQPQTVQASSAPKTPAALNLTNPEAVKSAGENTNANAATDAKAPVNEPKWESKNSSTADMNALKQDAAKLVQSELQKLDDSLDLNLVEQNDATESRVIPPPADRTAANEPGALPSEDSVQASDNQTDKPNNPLLEDIPQKETVQSENSVATTQPTAQPTEPTQTEANAPKEIVKAPFDPIKENGPIFVGWDVPKVALVITGQLNGYLEPCGCAGLERMRGGLSRRYSFIKDLRAKGWPVIPIDVGGMCNSFGKQAELKFHTTVSALRSMGYNAIALGKPELGFPAADLLSEIVNADGTPGMFVSANVSVFERNAGMPQTFKIIEANGLRFGITSVLCKSAQNFSQNDEILLSPTKESLNKVMPILKEKSHIRILLSYGTVEEAMIIARDYPDFQVIVTAGGNPEPPSKPTILPSGQYIITVGQKGMYSIVLGFFEKGVLKYQRVPYDSRFEQSDAVRQMMQSYQDQLKELWLQGLGIRAVPQTDPSRGANVGPKKCQTCHEYQYDVWKKSKHAHAFKSLEEAKPSRDYDPECVCCHVVGWHRHLYFPYQKGYIKPGEDDYLKNVSCEACHGPGEAHIAAESSSNVENQKAQREKMHLDLKYAKEKMCGDCHDLDNSPDFDPDKYWELVKHHDPEDDQ